MTCIVGLVYESGVCVGGDSAGVARLHVTVRADEKVFFSGSCLMGFTSSFRMGDLLRYKLTPPLRDPKLDLRRYMATSFVDAVRDTLKSGGYASVNNGVEEGGTFLVARDGRLFTVESDFQVGEAAAGYAAVGCGEAYALGALYASQGEPPERRVRMALEAAARFSGGVSEPFHVLHSPAGDAKGVG